MKALEILKKRKRTLLLIKASSVLTKKESIEIDEDIKDIDEAIAELEALQQPKSCESCKQCDYCEYLKVKYYENNFDGSATIREVYAKVPNDFCCNRYEKKKKL